MRVTSRLVLELARPPSTGELALLVAQLRGHLRVMVPEVETIAARQSQSSDLAACLALACAREARRKMTIPERTSPAGQLALALRLARILDALCNHHDALDPDAGKR
ncbi:DUF6415 family natural product biosynthesis protein [Streptomyces graminifolii]|uniref:DUF6415 family natural product biosynthesis protein n=1 Tax=Streptomyces graminifolii TaxID=1266771 RepID=UPI00405A1008